MAAQRVVAPFVQATCTPNPAARKPQVSHLSQGTLLVDDLEQRCPTCVDGLPVGLDVQTAKAVEKMACFFAAGLLSTSSWERATVGHNCIGYVVWSLDSLDKHGVAKLAKISCSSEERTGESA